MVCSLLQFVDLYLKMVAQAADVFKDWGLKMLFAQELPHINAAITQQLRLQTVIVDKCYVLQSGSALCLWCMDGNIVQHSQLTSRKLAKQESHTVQITKLSSAQGISGPVAYHLLLNQSRTFMD